MTNYSYQDAYDWILDFENQQVEEGLEFEILLETGDVGYHFISPHFLDVEFLLDTPRNVVVETHKQGAGLLSFRYELYEREDRMHVAATNRFVDDFGTSLSFVNVLGKMVPASVDSVLFYQGPLLDEMGVFKFTDQNLPGGILLPDDDILPEMGAWLDNNYPHLFHWFSRPSVLFSDSAERAFRFLTRRPGFWNVAPAQRAILDFMEESGLEIPARFDLFSGGSVRPTPRGWVVDGQLHQAPENANADAVSRLHLESEVPKAEEGTTNVVTSFLECGMDTAPASIFQDHRSMSLYCALIPELHAVRMILAACPEKTVNKAQEEMETLETDVPCDEIHRWWMELAALVFDDMYHDHGEDPVEAIGRMNLTPWFEQAMVPMPDFETNKWDECEGMVYRNVGIFSRSKDNYGLIHLPTDVVMVEGIGSMHDAMEACKTAQDFAQTSSQQDEGDLLSPDQIADMDLAVTWNMLLALRHLLPNKPMISRITDIMRGKLAEALDKAAPSQPAPESTTNAQ